MVLDINPGVADAFDAFQEGFYPKIFTFKDKLMLFADKGDLLGTTFYSLNQEKNSLSYVKDILKTQAKFSPFGAFCVNQNQIFFSGFDGTNGFELFVSDGSNTGTRMVKDINKSGSGVDLISNLVPSTNGCYFPGYGDKGLELWYSDGTEQGTRMVIDLDTTNISGNPANLMYSNKLNKLFFEAESYGSARSPYVSDGTKAGTQKLLNLPKNTLSGNLICHFIEFGDKVLFVNRYSDGNNKEIYDLYITDGTIQGTKMIYTTKLCPCGSLNNFTMLGDQCMFTAGDDLYMTDGTSQGTKVIYDQLRFDCWDEFYPLGNKIVFTACSKADRIKKLFVTDGTPTGTEMIGDLNLGACFNQYQFVPLYNKLYFIYFIDCKRSELWETDGSKFGTKRSFSIPGKDTRMINLVALSDRLYFIGTDATAGSELWEYVPAIISDNTTLSKNSAAVLPNPASKKLILQTEDIVHNVKLFSANGQQIMCRLEANNEMDISALPNGVYYLSYLNANNLLNTFRFVKI